MQDGSDAERMATFGDDQQVVVGWNSDVPQQE